jgi:hypothetical protein
VRELPTPKSFVSRKGAFGGYEVTGWRYAGDTAWHVKTRPKSQQQHETAYVVRDGAFDPERVIFNEKIAVLTLIAEWEAGMPDTETDSLDVSNPD